MRKFVGLLALLLAWGAPWAWAQVAVPEIGPGSVRTYDSRLTVLPSNSIVPENPAALRWGGPSRVVAGGLRGAASTATAGGSTSYNGTFAGLRAVGQMGAFAASTTHTTVKFPVAATLPRREKWMDSLALAFSYPGQLAWGVSATHYHADSTPGYPPIASINQEDSHGWTAGFSWRMGEHLFLGGGYGEDKADLKGAYTGRTDRRHGMVGVGLRGGGTLVWHLEADRFRYDDNTDPAGLVRLPGYEVTQYTAEGILGSWTLTYSGYKLQDTTGPAPQVQGYSADFGFTPLYGLNLAWRFEHSDSTDNGTKVASQEVNALTVAWLF